MFICNECSILVLSLHVAVDILHEKEMLQCNPFLEDLLSIVYREGSEVVAYAHIWIYNLAGLVVAADLLAWSLVSCLVERKRFCVSCSSGILTAM